MAVPHFDVKPHNAHYDGTWQEEDARFLAVCAHDKAANIAALLGPRASQIGSVLEVGCGTGVVLLELRRLGIGREHRGVDYADPHAHTDAVVAVENIPLEQYDGVRLPYDDASFDLVYATHVLEHVPEEQPFLAELKRVARKFLYLEVPCEITLRTSVASLQTTLDIGHLHPYTPETFALELARAGLEPAEFRVFDHSLPVHSFFGGKLRGALKMGVRRAALRASPFLASKVFCYHVGALCEIASPTGLEAPSPSQGA